MEKKNLFRAMWMLSTAITFMYLLTISGECSFFLKFSKFAFFFKKGLK